MADTLTIFSIVLLISLIISLATGVILLSSREISHKKRKTIGGILLGMSLLNFILFGMFIFQRFYYQVSEFIAIILFFIIPFIIGMELLSSHEIKKGLKKILGVLLILLPIVWIVIGIASY